MKIVMPLAGRGSKFVSAGFTEPKPLILIRNKPMILWATDSLPFIKYEDLIFIVLRDQIKKFQIDMKLRKMYGKKVKIIEIASYSQGAASTVLLAQKYIDTKEELVIYNSDQFFSAPLQSKIKHLSKGISGLIAVFHATHPKWSYVKANSDGFALEVREKEPFSTNATVGFYYFRKGSDFVWAAREMIRKNIRTAGEFYICPVYNELIKRGDKIEIVKSDYMWSLGTPEDVYHFEKYFKGDI